MIGLLWNRGSGEESQQHTSIVSLEIAKDGEARVDRRWDCWIQIKSKTNRGHPYTHNENKKCIIPSRSTLFNGMVKQLWVFTYADMEKDLQIQTELYGGS